MEEAKAIAIARASRLRSQTKLFFKVAFRSEIDGRSVWVISFRRPKKKNVIISPEEVFIYVDDQTGEVLHFPHP